MLACSRSKLNCCRKLETSPDPLLLPRKRGQGGVDAVTSMAARRGSMNEDIVSDASQKRRKAIACGKVRADPRCNATADQ